MSDDTLTLCCVGAGGHGRVVASQWNARVGTEVIFCDEAKAAGTTVDGVPVRFNRLDEIAGCTVLVTVGDNRRRRALQTRAAELGLTLACFVADRANYFGEPAEDGAMVLAGAVVNHAARIGAGAIVNSGAVVEHDCTIGAFAHISPNATIAGGCTIGAGAWVGAGACVIPQLVIAAGTVVGAGSTVVRDIVEAGTYVGIPARRIR